METNFASSSESADTAATQPSPEFASPDCFCTVATMVLASAVFMVPIIVVALAIAFSEQGRSVFYAEVASLDATRFLGFLAAHCTLGCMAGVWAYSMSPRLASNPGANQAVPAWFATWAMSLLTGLTALLALPGLLEIAIFKFKVVSVEAVDERAWLLSGVHAILWAFIALGTILLLLASARLYASGRAGAIAFALWAILGVAASASLVFFNIPYASLGIGFLAALFVWLVLPRQLEGLFAPRLRTITERPGPDATIGITLLIAMLFLSASFVPPSVFQSLGTGLSAQIAIASEMAWLVLSTWVVRALFYGFSRSNTAAHKARVYAYALFFFYIGVSSFTDFPLSRPLQTVGNTQRPLPELATFVQDWLDVRALAMRDASHPYPIILVAAPGGGLRASYWAAGILGALQDANPDFSNHVLAISSVSGGSVGAAIFAAARKSGCRSGDEPSASEQRIGCRKLASQILSKDFLAPTLFTLLTTDLLQATVRPVVLEDRALVLERSFEGAVADAAGEKTFGQPFDALYKAPADRISPAVFFNVSALTTDTASLAVVAPVSMTNTAAINLPDVQRALERSSLKLSTAAILSARFPFVSTSSLLAFAPGSNDKNTEVAELLDGGVYDNSGTATLAAFLPALQKASSDLHFKVFILTLSNRPLVSRPPVSGDIASAYGATPGFLANAVIVRESLFKTALEKAVSDKPWATMLPEVRPVAGKATFPLGWSLAGNARADLDNQMQAAFDAPSGALQILISEMRQN